MLDRQVINVAGILIDEKVVQAFGGCLHGALIRPGDESYDRSRSVWNGMIDRHPSMIVFCTDVDDVIRSVQFARAYELLVSIRSGGHNVAGNSVCDGGS